MHGYLVDCRHILAQSQSLPNNESTISENAVWVGNNDNRLELRVYANNDFTIANSEKFNIELVCSDDDTSYASPVENSHFCLINKTNADQSINVNKGDLLFAGGIPRNFVTGYIKLKFNTTANLSAGKIDAFVRVLA